MKITSNRVFVHGVSINVELHINLDQLSNLLGARASISAGRKSVLGRGAVRATVSAEDCATVKAARVARKADRKRILDEKRAADQQRIAEGRPCVHCGTLDARHSLECAR